MIQIYENVVVNKLLPYVNVRTCFYRDLLTSSNPTHNANNIFVNFVLWHIAKHRIFITPLQQTHHAPDMSVYCTNSTSIMCFQTLRRRIQATTITKVITFYLAPRKCFFITNYRNSTMHDFYELRFFTFYFGRDVANEYRVNIESADIVVWKACHKTLQWKFF